VGSSSTEAKPTIVTNRWRRARSTVQWIAIVSVLLAVLATLVAPAIGAPSFATSGSTAQVTDEVGASELFAGDAGSRIPGRYIVVLEDSVQSPAAVAENQVNGVDGEVDLVYRYALKGYSAELSQTVVRDLRNDPRVKYVVPEKKVEGTAQTMPTGIGRTFAPTNSYLDIDETDDARVNVDVAIIDSGIDITHPDLNVVSRTDCTISEGSCFDNTGTDEAGHGSHVAGTVGAIDNGSGVVGMAPGARLWSVRVLDKNNGGSSGTILAGVDWVTKRASTIEVANMSLAGEGREPALESALDQLLNKGVVVVVAAGNATNNSSFYWPANDPDVITVSAIADYDGKPGAKGSPTCSWVGNDEESYWFGNWGSGVDIAAPGVCILSSVPGGGYAEYTGTSMASPHVAGAAAVLASKANPESRTDVEGIRQQLIDEASLAWDDTSEDGKTEPLLYFGGSALTTPEAATAGMTSTDGSTAVVDGAFNSRGLEPRYKFEYGTTTSYGKVAPVVQGAFPYGTKYKAVKATLADLKPDVTYHYRLALTTNQGTVYGEDRILVSSRWTQDKAVNQPTQYGSEWYNDVSCIVGGFCMAVGHHYSSNGNEGGSVRYSNGQWTFAALPNGPGQDDLEGAGVSCTAANACTAVGRVAEAVGYVAFARRWNGSSWSTQTVPQPYSGAHNTVPLDVSCVSGTECLAVGFYTTAAGRESTYSAQWKGGSWSPLSTPTPEGSDQDVLEDVSCISSTSCTAVGWKYSPAGGQKPLIMKWNGSSWSFMQAARTNGTLASVSCTSETFCMGVSGGPSAERWNGEEWIVAQPKPGFIANLASVSCVSANYCVAVGGTRRLRDYGFGQVYNGKEWAIVGMPEQNEAIHRLSGVSCAGFGGCSAVGDYKNEGWGPLIVHRDETTTDPATSITTTGATLNGTIAGKGTGEIYSYYFEYGPTSSYGSKTSTKEVQSSASGNIEVSATLSDLDPETEMHFRLVASTVEGGEKRTVNGRDRQFRTTAVAPTFSTSFGSFGAGNGQFKGPGGIAFNADGTLWVTDGGNNRVQKFSASGQYLAQFGTSGEGNGQFKNPVDVAVTASGQLLVTDALNGRVQQFDAAGKYLGQIGSPGTGPGQFVEASHIALDASGNIYVSDHGYYRVLKFDSAGNFKQVIGGPSVGGSGPELASPSGVAIDPEGHLWVVDSQGNKVVQYTTSGQYISHFGAYGTVPGLLAEPGQIDFDARGRLWIADRSGRFQKFTQDGVYLTGISGLSETGGIALSKAGGIYVSNSIYVDRVEIWQLPVPTVTTTAASSIKGSQAQLNGSVHPQSLPATYRFEYGTTTSYGSSVPVGGKQLAAGGVSVEVSELATGLAPGTEYHYRLSASNAFGTVVGQDATFKTAAVSGGTFSGMAITDPFNGTSSAVSNFSTGWTALGWASGSPAKGENTASGWRAVPAYPTANGASYPTPLSDEGAGLGAVATMATSPGIASRYFSLWLDMPTPGSTKAGYELRFTNVSGGSTYNVTLDKWQGGVKTPLANQANVQFGTGSSFAVADEGGAVTTWVNTGSGFSELISATDSTFSSGTAGVEASGNVTRLVNFRFGSLLPPVANMDASLKAVALRDSFATNETPLSGGGAWAAVAWANGASGNKTGRVSGGWGPFDAFPSINGAFRQNESAVDTGAGVGVTANVVAKPGGFSRYFALMADMGSPGTTHNGYELRFTEVSVNSFEVVLNKWVAGSKSELKKVTGQTLALGSKIALVSKNGTVSAWVNSGAGYAQLLSAADATFTAGKTGVEGSGNNTRLSEFRSGPLPPF
jgi:subtilisin family serine protease/sugar lactone lactonase YvrE